MMADSLPFPPNQPIVKCVIFAHQPCALMCDGRCDKAWGIQNRPHVQLSEDEDDIEWLADGELDEEPANPGTTEGEHAKPRNVSDLLNKWCARECERSVLIDLWEVGTFPDFTQRIRNIPQEEAEDD